MNAFSYDDMYIIDLKVGDAVRCHFIRENSISEDTSITFTIIRIESFDETLHTSRICQEYKEYIKSENFQVAIIKSFGEGYAPLDLCVKN